MRRTLVQATKPGRSTRTNLRVSWFPFVFWVVILSVFLLSACVPTTQPLPGAPSSTPAATLSAPAGAAPTLESEETSPEPDELTIWGWKLHLLGSENVVDIDLFLHLHEDGELSGFTGCRSSHGGYQATGAGFQVFALEPDGPACADPAQADLERRYLETLARVERLWLGEDLVLTTDEDTQLTFSWQPVTVEPPPGWESYTQAEYGFQFHYPAGWRVQELPEDLHHLSLVKGTLALTVGFRRLEEEVPITRTRVPAGDLEERGWVEFLGGGVSRDVLVYQDNVKAVLYDQAREMEQPNGLVFTLSLDELGQEPYEAVDIPQASQLQIDWVLRTFQLLPGTEPTPAYPTPTP